MMEVKSIMDLKRLPHTFILPNGTKVILGDPSNFINCEVEECVVYKGAKIKKTNAVYYIPWDPVVIVGFRKATLKNKKDFKKLLGNIIEVIPEEVDKLLIKYNYFGIKVYDKFIRAKVIEFPLLSEVNGIKVYKALEPPNAFIYDSDMNKKLDPEQFHEVSYLRMAGNDIEFDKKVLLYMYMGMYSGHAELIYVPNDVKVTISNNESKQELTLEPGWFIFSSN